jgi:site-specific recombinase XerD
MDTSRGNLPDYEAFLTACGHPAGTREQYTGWPRRLLRDTGASPTTVTGQQVVGWLAAHDWAPNTRRKAVQGLRLYFGWLAAQGLRADDPTTQLKPVRGAKTLPRPAPEDVVRAALRNASGGDWWRLRLAAETGLRRAELSAVHSDDVTRGVLGWVLWVDGKGRRQRHVPIPDDLARWVGSCDGWVWPSPRGGHMIPSAVGKRYKRMLGGRWTTHTLRHRYATLAYAQSHDIEAVRALLGHDSVRTTQMYIATADEQLRQVAGATWNPGFNEAA